MAILDYLIVREFIKDTEAHSVEYKETMSEAVKRWYAIMDADINNSKTKYNTGIIFDRYGNLIRQDINDIREEKDPFYLLIRCFEQKDGTEEHSVERLTGTYDEAETRFYSVVAADMQEPENIYGLAILISGSGGKPLIKYFDRRPQPEPPVPPEPESETEQ